MVKKVSTSKADSITKKLNFFEKNSGKYRYRGTTTILQLSLANSQGDNKSRTENAVII